MMFEDKLDRRKLDVAIRKWALNLDGFDGAIGGVLNEIPWTEEMNKVISWDKIMPEFDKVIGVHPEFDIDELLKMITDSKEWNRLYLWSVGKSDEIADTYRKYINKLNAIAEMRSKPIRGKISKSAGVDHRGFVQYKDVVEFGGETVTEVAEAVWEWLEAHEESEDSGWKRNILMDLIHRAYHTKNLYISLCLIENSSYQFTFIRKGKTKEQFDNPEMI